MYNGVTSNSPTRQNTDVYVMTNIIGICSWLTRNK